LIVCVSVSHGNTRRVADAMAAVLGAPVRDPDDVDPDGIASYDLVGFGSGIFGFEHHRRLRQFVAQLPRVDDTKAFVFATSGTGRIVDLPLRTSLAMMLEARGFRVIDRFCCPGYDTWWPLRLIGGIRKGRPDASDLERAAAFVTSLLSAETHEPD
jgi:flavodoxin